MSSILKIDMLCKLVLAIEDLHTDRSFQNLSEFISMFRCYYLKNPFVFDLEVDCL